MKKLLVLIITVALALCAVSPALAAQRASDISFQHKTHPVEVSYISEFTGNLAYVKYKSEGIPMAGVMNRAGEVLLAKMEHSGNDWLVDYNEFFVAYISNLHTDKSTEFEPIVFSYDGNHIYAPDGLDYGSIVGWYGGFAGLWDDHACFAFQKQNKGFSETSYTVTVVDQNGLVLVQYTSPDEMQLVRHVGQGVFCFQDNSRRDVFYLSQADTVIDCFKNTMNNYALPLGSILYTKNGIVQRPSPVIRDGCLFGANDQNQMVLVNVSTGRITTYAIPKTKSTFKYGPLQAGQAYATDYYSYRERTDNFFFFSAESGYSEANEWMEKYKGHDPAPFGNYCDSRILLSMTGADGDSYFVIIDEKGRSLTEPVPYDDLSGMEEGRFSYAAGGVVHVCDLNGNTLFTLSGSDVTNCHEGVILVDFQGYDPNGNTLFLNVYDDDTVFAV